MDWFSDSCFIFCQSLFVFKNYFHMECLFVRSVASLCINLFSIHCFLIWNLRDLLKIFLICTMYILVLFHKVFLMDIFYQSKMLHRLDKCFIRHFGVQFYTVTQIWRYSLYWKWTTNKYFDKNMFWKLISR